MRSLLVRRLAPVLLLVAIAAPACASVERRAATVDGETITAESVQDELKIIRQNRAYRQAIEQSYGAKLAGAAKGTFDSAFTAQLLSLRVYYELIEQSLADLGVRVSKDDVERARTSISQQIATLGKNVWKQLPAEYRTQLAHQEALVEVAQQSATSGALAKRYFKAHEDEFEQACVSHILVSTENRSDPEAKARTEELKARLDAGENFAALANSDSDDPGAKDTGGDLDCGVKGRFVPEFDDAVYSLPIGKVSDPVKTQFGYHLILVRSRQAATIDDVGAQLTQQALNDYLLELTCGKVVNVDVDPRYGSWDRSPCKGGQGLAKVTAPAAPASGSTNGKAESQTP